MKKFLFTLIVVLYLFCTYYKTPVYADANFSTSLISSYVVQPNGVTHEIFTVVLKNLTDKFFASSYTMSLGFSDIENLHASDNDGVIIPVIKKTADGQNLTFTFNHRAIGLGSFVTLHFSFDTTNVARENGTIWEVNIPGVQKSSDFTNFTVNVSVPSIFGQPIYIKPDLGTNLTYTKDQLGTSGISLAFGHQQVYDFTLTYHLKNTQLFPVSTEIALPPNTSYQTISIDSIEPRPLNVIEDSDGNWLAQYSLLPGQLQTIHVKARAFVGLTPVREILSDKERASYLQQTIYWQSKDKKIQQLAKDLQTPYAIYQYVVKSLTYDYARVSDSQERLGASVVLQKPYSAVCLEFTDLFIALARAAGIPAREIDGYAYTQNSKERPLSLEKDVLHAWPEYYDDTRHTWIMVDPTWEKTTGGVDYFHTFDFDHVAFVVKGKDPDYPVPAGGYKLPQQSQQDVVATFADNIQQPIPHATFMPILPYSALAGIPITGKVTIQNTGTTLFPIQQLDIISSIRSLSPQTISTYDIPPYGFVTIPFSIGKTAFLTNQKGTVTMSLAGKREVYPLEIVPFTQQVLLIGGIIIGSFIITIFVIARRSRRVPISR